MINVEDFFIYSNSIDFIPEQEYDSLDLLITSFDAISRSTYQSLYIIDYYKKNFLYVSSNPLFLCGHSSSEVKELGYLFYLKHVPEEEQQILLEINKAGFVLFNQIPVEERTNFTLSYDFHLLNGRAKRLISHKITPLRLTSNGKVWLAACTVSVSSHQSVGNVEMRENNKTSYWRYSLAAHKWNNEERFGLSEREREILLLSCQGYTMNEIAAKLCIAIDTIKFHKRKLFEKLGVKNITEAIAHSTNYKLI